MRYRNQTGAESGSRALRWSRVAFITLCAAAMVAVSGCDDDGSPEPSIAETHDFGINNPNLIVAMGDSITTGINNVTPYPQMLASLLNTTVINEGFSGEHAYEGRQRVNGVLAQYRPGYLLLLYGANDLFHGGDADSITGDLRAMILAAKAAQTIPIVATLTPMARSHGVFDLATQYVNIFIRIMAAEEGVLVVDLEPIFAGYDNDGTPYVMEADDLLQWDGLHPNESGNWEIALAFADMIEYVMGKYAASQP